MKNVMRTIALGILFTFSIGSAHSALAASEVMGTLSSDGSSGPVKGQEAATVPGNAGGGNTLTGTVIGGVESDDRSLVAAAGSADAGAMMGLMWGMISLSLVVLAGAGLYFFGRYT